MSSVDHPSLGHWIPERQPAFAGRELLEAVHAFRQPALVVRDPATGRLGISLAGEFAGAAGGAGAYPLLGSLPALYPEWLGDRTFCETHGVRFPYVTGAMANGIATTGLVIAMARAGMLGFFGSAGLSHDRVTTSIDELVRELGHDGPPWGANLIHSPSEPNLEAGVVELYLARGVRRVSASAFMGLTLPVVRYASSGISRDGQGRIQRPNHLFAKISRPEVARHFLMPAPRPMLEELVRRGQLTAAEAALAAEVPVAEDFTVEADSGGHTDNRPLTALFPIILALRDDVAAANGYTRAIRIGAAGGLGTPSAIAAAFNLGAAYVLTGSVNQSAVEAGLSEAGRTLLARAGLADVVMAAAADMFELGVRVQVLKRGTMFGVRANKLYELYRDYPSLDALPASERATLEKDIFRMSLEAVWAETERFWMGRNPSEAERAKTDPRHKMALSFRWYLGLSSRWAIAGEPSRVLDYQIWCGPAMGAFNDWVRGSFLEKPENRNAVQIALNLLEGAAVITRAQQMRSYGVAVPPQAFQFRPRPLA